MDTAGDQGVSAPDVQVAHRGRLGREAGRRIEVCSGTSAGAHMEGAPAVNSGPERERALPQWQEERCSAGPSFDHLSRDEWPCPTPSSQEITVRRPLLY